MGTLEQGTLARREHIVWGNIVCEGTQCVSEHIVWGYIVCEGTQCVREHSEWGNTVYEGTQCVRKHSVPWLAEFSMACSVMTPYWSLFSPGNILSPYVSYQTCYVPMKNNSACESGANFSKSWLSSYIYKQFGKVDLCGALLSRPGHLGLLASTRHTFPWSELHQPSSS